MRAGRGKKPKSFVVALAAVGDEFPTYLPSLGARSACGPVAKAKLFERMVSGA